MDMKIDSAKVRIERDKRAWSQEQLADVAGIGVRTVQRIETSGNASPETVKALAVALNLTLDQLIQIPTSESKFKINFKKIGTGLCLAAVVLAVVILVLRPYQREFFVLSYGIDIDKNLFADQILIDAEIPREITINKMLRVVITASIENAEAYEYIENYEDRVLLQIEVFKPEGEEFIPWAKPRILTADDHEARIQLRGDNETSINIKLTPKLHRTWSSKLLRPSA